MKSPAVAHIVLQMSGVESTGRTTARRATPKRRRKLIDRVRPND